MNREVCKKCINETREIKWCKDDECDWHWGTVVCGVLKTNIDMEDGIPEGCRYQLEHTIMEDDGFRNLEGYKKCKLKDGWWCLEDAE